MGCSSSSVRLKIKEEYNFHLYSRIDVLREHFKNLNALFTMNNGHTTDNIEGDTFSSEKMLNDLYSMISKHINEINMNMPTTFISDGISISKDRMLDDCRELLLSCDNLKIKFIKT